VCCAHEVWLRHILHHGKLSRFVHIAAGNTSYPQQRILHIPQEYFISRQRYFILLSCSGKYTVDEPVKTMYNTTNSQ
jgi:hypothetical protein